ncbi:hypothetical protein [Sphingomonas paeninsulae]|jgi:hypothetical protein|uniref:hypothetical protein n=1 Tax=Sphingomonas paeninsulae TaxID=2319844 RepID=UPI0013CE6D73|nr:hypothetical protein [Sphingomonas paeninsulae]
MTIILIGMNDQYAVQVSDRRTSFDQQIHAEEYAKSFSLVLPGFRLMLGFTGIAHIGSSPTHDYLMTKLCEIGRTEHQPMPLIERVASSLSHRFTTFGHEAFASGKSSAHDYRCWV